MQWRELGEDRKIEIKDKVVSIIFSSSIAVWIISYSAWLFLGKSSFYIGNALAFFGICLTVYLSSIRIPQWIKTLAFAVSLNNLMDELFFDPTEINANEYLIFVAYLGYILVNKATKIRSKMKDISKFFTIDFSIIIVGFLSGLLSINKEENRKKTKWEKFIVGLSGFCSAVFLTPFIVWVMDIFFSLKVPHSVQLGIAYTVGQVGFKATDAIFDILERLKKLKKDETQE